MMLITNLEKVLTSLVMPTGLLWLFLAVLALLFYFRNRRKTAFAVFLFWFFLTVAGNGYVSLALMTWAEWDYRDVDSMAAGSPFDAVVVLGGGEGLTPIHTPQLNDAGDRVVLGARLYLTGRTKLLVAAGGADYENAEITVRLWRDLNVPADDILKINGRNTAAEMESLAALMADQDWERVGLVTSAFHMSRALRLARDRGLELEPLPADFRSAVPVDFRVSHFIPSGKALEGTEIVAKEILARLVGR